jgi:hypothetical protein
MIEIEALEAQNYSKFYFFFRTSLGVKYYDM